LYEQVDHTHTLSLFGAWIQQLPASFSDLKKAKMIPTFSLFVGYIMKAYNRKNQSMRI
jgi:hypothetical protein